MPAWITHYDTTDGESFFNIVYAKDEAERDRFIAERGLGEHDAQSVEDYMSNFVQALIAPVNPPVAPSEWFAHGKYPQCVHALIYLAAITVKTHPERAWELFDDTGVVHEAAHIAASISTQKPPEEILAHIRTFERSVPGFLPDTPRDEAQRQRFLTKADRAGAFA